MKKKDNVKNVKFLKNLKESIESLQKVREQISKVIVGQEEVIELVLIALLSEGHVLLEGVPGLGKTMIVRALSDALHLQFSRIQFTPDLMPADIIGTNMIDQADNNFNLKFEKGPLFANLILADEINRASPKTQSALLEAMQERTVTVRGQKYLLPRPFQVLATQNPLEMEGTYPLPEAQIDRFFFKVLVKHPLQNELVEIIDRTVGSIIPQAKPVLDVSDLGNLQKAVREIVVPSHVTEFAADIILATQPEHQSSMDKVKQYVRYGSGPRGAQTLVLAAKAKALVNGRYNASREDIERLICPALRHRISLNFDGQSDGISTDQLLEDVVKNVSKQKDYDKSIKVKVEA
jgi:MoxR-like ATPase